jgi:pimeloyl-ACP methyl ester carboxylesterase
MEGRGRASHDGVADTMMIASGMPPLLAPLTAFADVRLSNGVRLHYAQQGPRSGAALVLLHGFTDSWFSFSRVMPLLPPELRLIAPDLRGHGDSDRPAAGYRVSDMADDIVRLMDALRISQAVVVGHSMGSFVARRVAALASTRVQRLVLVGAATSADNQAVRELKQTVDRLTDPISRDYVRGFQTSMVAQPVQPSFMEAVVAISCRTPARVWQAALAGLLDEPASPVRLACRTLVLGGRQDAVFSATEQMVLARQFPRGELELVDGIGHSLHWENPAKFVSALARFGV